MSAPRQVIAVVVDGLMSPVLDSQVVVPLTLIGRYRPEIRRALLVLTSWRHRRNPAAVQRARALAAALPGVHTEFRYRLPLGTPGECWLWARSLDKSLRGAGFDPSEPTIVHCRGEFMAAAAARLKRHQSQLRIILDLRGAAVDEVPGKGLLSHYRRWKTARALAEAVTATDAVNCVSHKMLEHFRTSGIIPERLPAAVVGCCMDTGRFFFDPHERARQRATLALGDRFVLCYCGAMSHWQRPDVIAAAFDAVRRARTDVHLLIISKEAHLLTQELTKRSVPESAYTAVSAAHTHVRSFLAAADVGLLLRENTLTNRVASPVKFAEYLGCGLPVIVSRYVGDFSDLVAAEGVGQVVDFPPAPEEFVSAVGTLQARLTSAGDAYRRRCSELAAQRFSWETQLPELLRLYDLAAQSAPQHR